MIPSDVPAWLFHDVPLWAFLAALLTRPSTWSRRVAQQINQTSESEPTEGYK
jgi:hypothetical protein